MPSKGTFSNIVNLSDDRFWLFKLLQEVYLSVKQTLQIHWNLKFSNTERRLSFCIFKILGMINYARKTHTYGHKKTKIPNQHDTIKLKWNKISSNAWTETSLKIWNVPWHFVQCQCMKTRIKKCFYERILVRKST